MFIALRNKLDALKMISNIIYVLRYIFQMYRLQNTGSSQNVLILAKGEPLYRLDNTYGVL